MKTEKYLLEHMNSHHIPVKQVENDVGINMEQLVREEKDLKADEFLSLCVYLGIEPEEISDHIM